MRRAAKVDDNQSAIIAALRQIGCSVQDLSKVGGGCPDLLVGRGGFNWLLEVKDGDKPPSKRKLTPYQVDFHKYWDGQAAVVHNVADAIMVINSIQRGIE